MPARAFALYRFSDSPDNTGLAQRSLNRFLELGNMDPLGNAARSHWIHMIDVNEDENAAEFDFKMEYVIMQEQAVAGRRTKPVESTLIATRRGVINFSEGVIALSAKPFTDSGYLNSVIFLELILEQLKVAFPESTKKSLVPVTISVTPSDLKAVLKAEKTTYIHVDHLGEMPVSESIKFYNPHWQKEEYLRELMQNEIDLGLDDIELRVLDHQGNLSNSKLARYSAEAGAIKELKAETKEDGEVKEIHLKRSNRKKVKITLELFGDDEPVLNELLQRMHDLTQEQKFINNAKVRIKNYQAQDSLFEELAEGSSKHVE